MLIGLCCDPSVIKSWSNASNNEFHDANDIAVPLEKCIPQKKMHNVFEYFKKSDQTMKSVRVIKALSYQTDVINVKESAEQEESKRDSYASVEWSYSNDTGTCAVDTNTVNLDSNANNEVDHQPKTYSEWVQDIWKTRSNEKAGVGYEENNLPNEEYKPTKWIKSTTNDEL